MNKLLLQALTLVALFVSACGPASGQLPTIEATAPPTAIPATAAPTLTPTPTSERGQGDTLRLIYWQAPTIINSHLSAGTKDLSASRITYEPLASFDQHGNSPRDDYCRESDSDRPRRYPLVFIERQLFEQVLR